MKERTATPQPPTAKRVPQEFTIHGHTLSDPYAWLKEKKNPEVAAYLEAENAYTDAVMKSTEALQEALYEELLGHVKQTDVARWHGSLRRSPVMLPIPGTGKVRHLEENVAAASLRAVGRGFQGS